MFNPERQESDLVAELRRWGALKVGEPIPANGWGPPLTALLLAAASEIETLRAMAATAGAAAVGQSFTEITKDLPRRSGESD